MKTKLTLLVGTLALAGMSYAGPSDAAAFAIRHAQENAGNTPAPAVAAATNSSSFTYVPASNGKGGTVLVASRDEAVTNIALVKSSNKTSCDGAACCAKH